MGGTKQFTIWQSADGPKSLVAAAYDAVGAICDDMIVVLGHQADAVSAALRPRVFHSVLSDADEPMFESIRAGLCAACDLDPNATILLHPADHPEVAPNTLALLQDWSARCPAQAVLPQIGAHGGHPAFIPAQIALLLVIADCPTGLGDFWRANPELCVRVPIDDPAALRDIDTPADLE